LGPGNAVAASLIEKPTVLAQQMSSQMQSSPA